MGHGQKVRWQVLTGLVILQLTWRRRDTHQCTILYVCTSEAKWTRPPARWFVGAAVWRSPSVVCWCRLSRTMTEWLIITEVAIQQSRGCSSNRSVYLSRGYLLFSTLYQRVRSRTPAFLTRPPPPPPPALSRRVLWPASVAVAIAK